MDVMTSLASRWAMAKRCRSQTAAGRGTRANCMRTRTEDAAAELGGEKKQLERKTMASSISTHPGAHENWLFFILLPSFRVPTSATAAVSLKRTVLIFFFFFCCPALLYGVEVGGPEKLAWFPPSFLPLLILLFLSWLRQWAARFLSPVVCCVEELRHCRRSSKSWRAIFFSLF